MASLFVAGSIAISRLHSLVIERLRNAADQGMAFIVGDANGVDRAVQDVLATFDGASVKIFCSGEQPRNNVGDWPVQNVYPTALPGTRAFFTAKDVEMAARADFGLMIWDARSTGTLSNVFELMGRGRKTVVFVNRDKQFLTVADVNGVERLVSFMSSTALAKADAKMGLHRRLHALRTEQYALAM